MDERGISRRELVAAGLAGAALGLPGAPAVASARWSRRLDFSSLPDGKGWPGWVCPGVATLRREGGKGLLEAGSDVFPCDPRPVAFAVDRRFRDGQVSAQIASSGAGVGLVLRRVAPRKWYGAVYDDEQRALILVRRSPDGLDELARLPAPAAPDHLTFAAKGARPTELTAMLEIAGGPPVSLTAHDASSELQRPGDPGVFATARTLFPSAGPPVLPALGNLHLLPYGVQEGEAVIASPGGQQVIGTIRERSTAVFGEIAITASGKRRATPATVVAATTGAPREGGAGLRVAADLPAQVEIEVARDSSFRRSRRLRARPTDGYEALLSAVSGLPSGRRAYWRARLRRRGLETIGPVRSFRTLPGMTPGATARIAIGACASQFGPIFDHLTAARPDAFVWQGDLNYPDTVGPLAQNLSGYAGIWRDFLANPKTADLFDRAMFAAQRDDHDYGVQDANSTDLVPWGLAPWEGLMERRLYYRFTAGPAEFWVLDQRRHKSDPKLPDTTAKTLLGDRQRAWLLRTLASSQTPFKVICSPCTVALPANGRDGNWSSHFTAERDLLLRHIRRHVSGRTLFVTGDTHWTMVYDRGGIFEARPCPLGIPTPNDITLTSPNAAEDARKMQGVLYADDEKSHLALVDVAVHPRTARLDLTLLREDGATPFTHRFDEPLR